MEAVLFKDIFLKRLVRNFINLFTFLRLLCQDALDRPLHTLHSVARWVGSGRSNPPVHKRMKSSFTAFWGGLHDIEIGTNDLNSGLRNSIRHCSGGLDTCDIIPLRYPQNCRQLSATNFEMLWNALASDLQQSLTRPTWSSLPSNLPCCGAEREKVSTA